MIPQKITDTRITMASLSGLVIFFMLISLASAVPTLPYTLYGSATINDRPVPSGSVLTAEIDGSVKGSVVLDEDGVYGRAGGTSEKLMISNGQQGEEVVFYIQTPQMSNRLKASETATYKIGEVEQLELTFSGEEIPKPSGGSPSGGSSSSGGGSGSGGTGTAPEEPSQPVEQPSLGANRVLELSGSEPSDIGLSNKDTVTLVVDGNEYPILLKSMSDFSVLLEYQGEDLVLGVGDSRELDLNSDYVTDIEISLESIVDGEALLSFARLDKDVVEAGVEGITGYAAANPLLPGIITIILLAALGGSVYKLKRRSSL